MAYFRFEGNDRRNTQYTAKKHNIEVKNFLKSINLTSRDLLKHPCIDDLKLLVDIKRDLWVWLNQKEKDFWEFYWFLSYTDRKPLNRKAVRRLRKIVENVIYRQNVKYGQVQKIKALREQ